jgi:predicted nucleic acid-binding protein
LRLNRPIAADQYELLVSAIPNLRIVDVNRETARRAAELRAVYRLQAADAVQVAAGLQHGATAFLTNDKGIRRVAELEVVLLDDFVSGI